MTPKMKLELRRSEVRKRLAAIAALEGDEFTDEVREEVGKLRGELETLEERAQALILSGDDDAKPETRQTGDGERDGEARERAELRSKVKLGGYVAAAIEGRAAGGAESEYNSALGIGADRFPLELLAPAEDRATTDTDTQTTPRRWLDRLFAETAAMRLGITFESVPEGVSSFPLTTAGASFAMKERGAAAADAAWTIGVVEAKPKRATVRAVFSIEDAARLPGLEDSLTRDARKAMTEGVDRAIFVGADAGSADTADITGLQTATITEATITQTNKVKGPETLAEFAGMVDGTGAMNFADLRVVTSVGAWRLWESTVINSAADNMTLAAFLRAAGLSWSSRDGIDTNTANGDFGAFVGKSRGIAGAGVAAVRESGMLIRDPYTDAAKGEVALTLVYLWDLVLPRTASFQRVKFVT